MCKVTEFGIAQLHDSSAVHTREGASMGTAGFMAPEQRTDASSTDVRADVFSLGATLYSLLTAGDKPLDLFAAEPADLEKEQIPEPIIAILLKASRYRREERYPECAALSDALLAVVDSLPTDPPTAPLGAGAPTARNEPHASAHEAFTLPDGVFDPKVTDSSLTGTTGGVLSGTHTAHTSHTSGTATSAVPAVEPPAPKIIPYQMPKVSPSRRQRGAADLPEALPDYVDSASMSRTPAGFDVNLGHTDRIASEKARRGKGEPAADSNQPVFAGEAGAKTSRGSSYEIIASTLAMLIRPLLLVSVVGSLLGTVLLGGIWVSAGPLRRAEDDALLARAAYYHALEADASKIKAALVDLGARQPPIDDLIHLYEASEDDALRLENAEKLGGYLRAEATTRYGLIAPAQASKLQLVDGKLAAIERLSGDLQGKRLLWKETAEAPAARAAIQLGLAAGPD